MARNPKPIRRMRKRLKLLWSSVRKERVRGCRHTIIVESRRYEDGSVDGKCVRCGEDGFPIRDVAWEEYQRTEGTCCGFGGVTP